MDINRKLPAARTPDASATIVKVLKLRSETRRSGKPIPHAKTRRRKTAANAPVQLHASSRIFS
jgi:hypothetical protein